LNSEVLARTAAPLVIETDDGPVTQVSLQRLQEIAAQNQQSAQLIRGRISQLQAESTSNQTQAGAILSTQQTKWPSAERGVRIEAAHGLERLISNLEQRLSRLEGQPHRGIGGFLHALTDRHEIQSLQSQLQSAKTELAIRYSSVAEGLVSPTGLSDADLLLQQIRTNQELVTDLAAQEAGLASQLTRISDEIKRRKEAVATLGFDAPAVEADLQTNGLRPIATSLVLKRDEIAAAAVSASLCRYKTRTQYVGASHGLSIPLGHGFRYRVSSFRGHPIQVESLAQVDQGTLVVTNQRLVFLGSKRDVSIPIAKLLQVEAFSNAVGIAREGKEAREIYLVSHPAYIVLFIHWVVSHQP
jgi:hypothetical protein